MAKNSTEILKLAGMALYQAQVFEVALTNLAVGLYASKQSSLLKSDIVAMFDHLEKDTLGKILKQVRKHMSLDDEAEAWLTRLIDTRNNIAHKFFRTHASDLMNAHGRKLMANELQKMVNEFWQGHLTVEEMYLPLWAALGVTEERMLFELEQMKRDAESSLEPT